VCRLERVFPYHPTLSTIHETLSVRPHPFVSSIPQSCYKRFLRSVQTVSPPNSSSTETRVNEEGERETERGIHTANNPTSNKSLPDDNFASGYCFFNDSNSPLDDLKSGIPDAVEIPAPLRSRIIAE